MFYTLGSKSGRSGRVCFPNGGATQARCIARTRYGKFGCREWWQGLPACALRQHSTRRLHGLIGLFLTCRPLQRFWTFVSDATGGTWKATVAQPASTFVIAQRAGQYSILPARRICQTRWTSCDEDAGVRHGWRTPHVECTDLPDPRSPILVLGDYAKETVFFVRDASGEKDSVGLREKIP